MKTNLRNVELNVLADQLKDERTYSQDYVVNAKGIESVDAEIILESKKK